MFKSRFFYNNVFFKIGILFLIMFILITNYQVFNKSYQKDKRYQISFNVNLFDIESINHCMNERLFNLQCLKRQTFVSFKNYLQKNELVNPGEISILEINILKKTVILSVNEKYKIINNDYLYLEQYNRYLAEHFEDVKKSLNKVFQIAINPGAPHEMQQSLLGWNLINIFYIIDLQQAIENRPGIEIINVREIKFFRKHIYINLIVSLMLSLTLFILYHFNKKIKNNF